MATHASEGISEIFRQYTGLDDVSPESVQTKPEPEGEAPEPWEKAAQNGPLEPHKEVRDNAVADGPAAPEDDSKKSSRKKKG